VIAELENAERSPSDGRVAELDNAERSPSDGRAAQADEVDTRAKLALDGGDCATTVEAESTKHKRLRLSSRS